MLPLAAVSISATEPAQQCKPPRIITPAQAVKLAPNSTYVNNKEPPARFLHPVTGYVKVRFGQASIDKYCDPAPCKMRVRGCAYKDVIVVPDPTDPEFARILRHELAHFNGWPATHGD